MEGRKEEQKEGGGKESGRKDKWGRNEGSKE